MTGTSSGAITSMMTSAMCEHRTTAGRTNTARRQLSAIRRAIQAGHQVGPRRHIPVGQVFQIVVQVVRLLRRRLLRLFFHFTGRLVQLLIGTSLGLVALDRFAATTAATAATLVGLFLL